MQRSGAGWLAAIVVALAVAAPGAAAQAVQVGASAVPLVTHATPATLGEARTEGYLTQPVVMAHGSWLRGRLGVDGMLNLEGLTLGRGELNAGIWGEGYVDRRHPHTYLHELVATGWIAGRPGAEGGLSLSAGRGFVPFGTDDPMARGFVKFPGNHHLAQLLERYHLTGAARRGPVAMELGVFNGNEPTGPGSLEGIGRLGDSWAGRLTLFPAGGVEVQGSYADVASPEFPVAARIDQRKWSASARWQRGGVYGLAEWARTEELASGRRFNTFHSALVELAARHRGLEAGVRWERTSRPEEERLADPFRTAVPHSDVHLLGITRWNTLSARLGAAGSGGSPLRAAPFLELSRAAVAPVLPGQLFEPAGFFGSDRIWTLSAGVRLGIGAAHGRMGRYGAARDPGPAADGAHHQH